MRIIIDTTNKQIICPKAFWDDIRKANEVLREAGQPEKVHAEVVRNYFEEAMKGGLAGNSKVR